MQIKIHTFKYDKTVTTLNDYLKIMSDLHGKNLSDYFTSVFENALINGSAKIYHNFYGYILIKISLNNKDF